MSIFPRSVDMSSFHYGKSPLKRSLYVRVVHQAIHLSRPCVVTLFSPCCFPAVLSFPTFFFPPFAFSLSRYDSSPLFGSASLDLKTFPRTKLTTTTTTRTTTTKTTTTSWWIFHASQSSVSNGSCARIRSSRNGSMCSNGNCSSKGKGPRKSKIAAEMKKEGTDRKTGRQPSEFLGSGNSGGEENKERMKERKK